MTRVVRSCVGVILLATLWPATAGATTTPDDNASWNTNADGVYAGYEDQVLTIAVDAPDCDTAVPARLTIDGAGTAPAWFDETAELDASGHAEWTVELPSAGSGGGLNFVVFTCTGESGPISSERRLFNTVIVEAGSDLTLTAAALVVIVTGVMLQAASRRPRRLG